jgi:hypothetical protein
MASLLLSTSADNRVDLFLIECHIIRPHNIGQHLGRPYVIAWIGLKDPGFHGRLDHYIFDKLPADVKHYLRLLAHEDKLSPVLTGHQIDVRAGIVGLDSFPGKGLLSKLVNNVRMDTGMHIDM